MTQRGQEPGYPYGNAIAHARQQLQFGQSVASIESQLARKYPSLNQLDIRSAIVAAMTARELGRQLTSGDTSSPPRSDEVPVNVGIPSAYQYVVNISFAVGGEDEYRTRTVVVNTPTLLSSSDLLQEAEDQARVADGLGELNTDGSMVDWTRTPYYRIDAVYRRNW